MTYFKNYLLVIAFFLVSSPSFAWGSKGHAIVAEIAFKYLDANTKNIVLQYLDGMTIQEAANWMDDLREDRSYDFMKPYHYVNFEKGSCVKNNHGDNIISILSLTINELKNYKTLPKAEVKKKLCIIFHLIGDLHQPLHVGYGVDKGGNKIQINFNGNGTNLHAFYDSGIIKHKNITLQDCLNPGNFNQRQRKHYVKINVVKWAKQSRSYLDTIYNFNGNKVSEEYVAVNTPIIKKQLFLAGIRLAAVLKITFKNSQQG